MKTLAVVLTLLLLASLASAATINATGSGWCNEFNICNNADTSMLANTFAGTIVGTDVSVTYADWFAFALPASGIGSATISIWNDGQNSNNDPSAVYGLQGPASSISFSGLVCCGATSMGSISVSAADTGSSYYVTITITSAGVAALNANLGSTFIFGGEGGTNQALESKIFGFTDGTPVAYLTTTSVPEPRTFVMLGSGILGLAGTLRRKLL